MVLMTLSDAAPLPAMVTMVGLIVFGVNVGVSAYERSNELLNGKTGASANLQINLKGTSQLPNSTLIGINSTYAFLLTSDKTSVLVVPKDQVDFIRINKR
jgi:xanthosine utilization system XapX-like protein